MRWELTASARSDFRRLSDRDKHLFREAVQTFSVACDRYIASGGTQRWPAALRVKPVESAPGVLEMTWSFTGPDGRATWEWSSVEVQGERRPVVRWRRIGDHRVFRQS